MDDLLTAADDQDRVLVRRYLNGEQAAAWELVDRYQGPLFTVALRMLGNQQDAEDVTQTVFGNAFRALHTYDPKYRFFSWVYRMTVNESLNALRRRRQTVTIEDHPDIPIEADSGDDAMEAEVRVNQALQQLKPDDRAVVVLRHFQSLSYDAIGEVLGIPSKTVKSRLFTARERLRSLLLA